MKVYIAVSIILISISLLTRLTKNKFIQNIGNLLMIIGFALVVHDILAFFDIEFPPK